MFGSVAIDDTIRASVSRMRGEVAIQVQTGNIARAFYDLVKMQTLYIQRRALAAVLILPDQSAAGIIGSNVANMFRVSSELRSYDRVITIPLLCIWFR